MTKLVLASASPRRHRLLAHLVDDFQVDPADIDETAPRSLPVPEALQVIARKKALAVSHRHRDRYVLGADTVVVHRGKILGKASGAQEARLQLATLSGETHQVWTGIALAFDQGTVGSDAAATALHIQRLPPTVLDAYIRSGAWEGKAGAYGIQDPLLAPFMQVQSGPWSNVVGLPMAATSRLLSEHGISSRSPPDETWLQQHAFA